MGPAWAAIALVWLWVSAICGMPFWQYVLFIAYLGNALQVMRSYAEHRAHEEAELPNDRRRDQSDRCLAVPQQQSPHGAS